jgi:hypothetical protein
LGAKNTPAKPLTACVVYQWCVIISMSGGIITTHRWYVVYSFVEAVHVGSMGGFFLYNHFPLMTGK